MHQRLRGRLGLQRLPPLYACIEKSSVLSSPIPLDDVYSLWNNIDKLFHSRITGGSMPLGEYTVQHKKYTLTAMTTSAEGQGRPAKITKIILQPTTLGFPLESTSRTLAVLGGLQLRWDSGEVYDMPQGSFYACRGRTVLGDPYVLEDTERVKDWLRGLLPLTPPLQEEHEMEGYHDRYKLKATVHRSAGKATIDNITQTSKLDSKHTRRIATLSTFTL